MRSLAIAAIQRRIDNGDFTERSLARRARLSQSAVHNILADNRIGTLETLDKLYKAAGIFMEELQRD